MAKAIDVAAYILKKKGPMTAMKLQKLLYYSQAWSLVWEEKPLFRAKIEAWANGPVVPSVYRQHAGNFRLSKDFFEEGGDPAALSKQERSTVDAVLKFYGSKSSQWLSDLTHRERPWRRARRGVPDGSRSDELITLESMAEYYGGLL